MGFYKSIKWNAASSLWGAASQIIQLFIAARYFDATEFGILSIIMIIYGFAQTFMDMGLSNAIIHHQELSKETLSTLYWINLIFGLFICLIIFYSGDYISSYYNIKNLDDGIDYVVASLLALCLVQQHSIILQKLSQFDVLAKIEILSKAVFLICFVVMIYFNLKLMAFYNAMIFSALSQCIALFIAAKDVNKISFSFHPCGLKKIIIFGLYQSGEKIVNYINYQIDALMIGKFFGPSALGYYNLAKQLTMKPSQIINPIFTRVAFPAMASKQDDNQYIADIYLKMSHWVTFLNFYAAFGLILYFESLLLPILGNKWSSTSELIAVLAIYAAFRAIGNPVGSLILAKGKAREAFLWNVMMLLLVPTVVFSFAKAGIIYVGYGLSALSIGLLIPVWYLFIRKLARIPLRQYMHSIVAPIAYCIIIFFAAFATQKFFIASNIICAALYFISGIIFFLLNKNRKFGGHHV